MSCKRFQHEMSLALDGRLPSQRRAVLRTHRDRCSVCARIWVSMREAQDLILGLPPMPIGSGFRRDLWERIESGEAPEITLREPIPMAAKVRYVLGGAAAAACALFVLHLTRDDQAALQPPAAEEIASAMEMEDAAPSRPSKTAGMGVDVVPVSAQNAAEIGAETMASNVSWLKQKAQAPGFDRLPLPEARRELEPNLQQIRVTAPMIHWLTEEEFLELPPDTAKTLGVTERLVQRVEQARNTSELRRALEQLQTIDVRKLRRFLVVCCDKEPEFQQKFSYRVVSGAPWRDLFPLMFTGVDGSGLDGIDALQVQIGGNGGQRVFMFRTQVRRHDTSGR